MISVTLVTSLAQFGYFEPVYADHDTKVIKLNLAYPADVGFIDIPLPMRIDDVDNTIVFLSFSTPDSADQSDTSRRWELINDRTLRVFGESNTPTGNNAGNLVIYIVELNNPQLDISNQNLLFNMTADETPSKKSIELPQPVNSSRAFALYNGLENLASDTTWGSEEFVIVSLNNTHLDFETTTIANTDSNYGFSVVQLNLTGVLVQRGTGVLNGTSPDDEVTDTITPPTAVDRDHTVLLLTTRVDGVAIENADPDEIMVQATIDSSGDIVIHRDDNAPLSAFYEWQLISFPSFLVNVTHGEIAMTDGEFIITDTITPVRDFDRSFVISGVGSPFGYGTGSCDTGTAGAMDRCMNRLILTHMDTVTAIREDDTGTNVVNYQVIQILEIEDAEEPQGTNILEQIVKIKGTVQSGIENDFTISPALTNVDKTLVFTSFSNDGTGGGDPSGGRKSYEIFNATTLRFFGNADPSISNPTADFTAYLVEFTDSSPVVVQNEFFTYQPDLDAGEKTIHMSSINTTGSSLINLGRHLTGTDTTVGAEEIDRVRILTSNTWGYDVDEFQNFGDASTTLRIDIVDYNQNDIFSQRGQLSMSTATASVTPPIAIVQNQTMLLFSHTTSDGDLTASPDTSTVHATIDATGDIDFFRPVATGTLEINWELVSFPDTLLTIEHGIHHQDIGTRNATSTITPVGTLANSFAIGTEGLIGYGTGSGDNATDSVASFLGVIATVELEDDSTVRVVRGTSTGDFDIGFQVLEFAGQIFNQTVTDVVTAVDLATDITTDTTQSDIAQILDQVDLTSIFVVNLDDDGVTSDVIRFNITKLFSDGVPIFDDPELDITKRLSELAVVNDSIFTNVTTTFDEDILDTVTPTDLIILNITKQVDDTATVTDNVDISRILSLLVNDTTTVNDPTILFIISSVVPVGSGVPTSADTTGGIPSFQRLVGLSILSESFIVDPADRVSSDFIIQTFGREDSTVSITEIEVGQEFMTWFEFSSLPDVLLFDTEVDNSRLLTDPARFKNIALDDFILNIPSIACEDVDPFITPVPCVDPIIYEAPLKFTFSKGGVEFRENHIVLIDATTTVIQCDLICQIVEYIIDNYWWLAGILIMFMMMYFLGVPTITGKRIRTIRRVDSRHFESFEVGRHKKKFKRGKRK